MLDEHKTNFDRWFADSKVVDHDGKPLVVYHGTQKDVSAFKLRPKAWAANNVWGHFFTQSPSNAGVYAEGSGIKISGANIMPVFLSIQNPYVMPWQEWQHFNTHLYLDEAKLLKSKVISEGYDGIIDNSGMEFVAFRSQQVKSAIGNSGLYNLLSPDITDRIVAAESALDYLSSIPCRKAAPRG